MLKTCSECGKEFQTRGSAKRCGPPCSAAYAKRYDVERSKNPMRAASRAKRKRERIATDEEYRLSQRAINAKRIKERIANEPGYRERVNADTAARNRKRNEADPEWIARRAYHQAKSEWLKCPIVQRLKRIARYNKPETLSQAEKRRSRAVERWHTEPEWRAMRYAMKARNRGYDPQTTERWLAKERERIASDRAGWLIAAQLAVASELGAEP